MFPAITRSRYCARDFRGIATAPQRRVGIPARSYFVRSVRTDVKTARTPLYTAPPQTVLRRRSTIQSRLIVSYVTVVDNFRLAGGQKIIVSSRHRSFRAFYNPRGPALSTPARLLNDRLRLFLPTGNKQTRRRRIISKLSNEERFREISRVSETTCQSWSMDSSIYLQILQLVVYNYKMVYTVKFVVERH